MKKSVSMGAGLIDDFIRNILSVPFCPYHFVHTILSATILSVYHFVHTILSVPFCLLPFCPRTGPNYRGLTITTGLRFGFKIKSHKFLWEHFKKLLQNKD